MFYQWKLPTERYGKQVTDGLEKEKVP